MNTPAVYWLDMQLSPSLAEMVTALTGVPCQHFDSLGLSRSTDLSAFNAANAASAAIITKDSDFAQIAQKSAPPPWILWLRCGNKATSETADILGRSLPRALELMAKGERIVEVID